MAHRMEAYFGSDARPLAASDSKDCPVDAQIVVFPDTRVAAIEHFGSLALEHDAVRKLIAWKPEQRLLDPLKCRSYEHWPPQSGELPGKFPIFFHNVNVGSIILEQEMITAASLRLKVCNPSVTINPCSVVGCRAKTDHS